MYRTDEAARFEKRWGSETIDQKGCAMGKKYNKLDNDMLVIVSVNNHFFFPNSNKRITK